MDVRELVYRMINNIADEEKENMQEYKKVIKNRVLVQWIRK